MTEAEKQAISKLREIIEYDKKHRLETIYDKEQIEFRNNIELMLNLIEKLQKENEELKNKVAKRNNELIELDETSEKEFITKQEVKEKIENLKMKLSIYDSENRKLKHIVMSLPNGLEILEKL